MLLVSKCFHHHLSPHTSPYIIKQLIQNECHGRLLLYNRKPNNKLYDYNIDASKQWINLVRNDYEVYLHDLKTKASGDDNDSFENDSKNALSSSLYFMHILHKIRNGAMHNSDEIKCLFEKLLNSYGGALGIRYLLWFLMRVCVYSIGK